jgi:hypothetical protein
MVVIDFIVVSSALLLIALGIQQIVKAVWARNKKEKGE